MDEKWNNQMNLHNFEFIQMVFTHTFSFLLHQNVGKSWEPESGVSP
jgi:hypothetical protein